jgi:anti-sigma factor RsiW
VTHDPPDPSGGGAPIDPPDPSGGGAPADPPDDTDDIDDAIIVALSDYLDGTLAPAARADVERHLAGDAAWQRAHAELLETRNFLSGMRKAHAPSTFTESVAETIHQRSAGRFFGRRTLGDRVPFGALLIVALVVLLVLAYFLYASSTGSLKVDRNRTPADPGSAVIDHP